VNEIICPHCKTAFKVDEAAYANILTQVRTKEFDKQLHDLLANAEKEKQSAIQAAQATLRAELSLKESAKEQEITKLQAKIDQNLVAQENAVMKAVGDVEKKRTEIEKERESIRTELANVKLSSEREINTLKASHQSEIKIREDMLQQAKDFKLKMSTKMVGESLEVHCENEFNHIRSMAFPNAYFEKDNDASKGSKGDFIFRDYDSQGVEIISIMFEMKNESDATATKSKNELFYKELDKDRTVKKCEYAILVSMLEADNEHFNKGIVDVSHRHEKMYVIRPQFFISMISILRKAAMKSLEYKNEIALMKSQTVDVTKFEEQLEGFKNAFSKSYTYASNNFETAIAEIDKSIDHLQKTKDALLKTSNHLRIANDKAQDVTIKKLTKGNPTMTEKFDNLKGSGVNEA
jgi:hypothetical protein